jgi:hypothetical protein
VTEGRKYDSGKPRVSLLPVGPLLEVCRVLTYGAEKYTLRDASGNVTSDGANNWQLVAGGSTRYLDAAGRHLLAYMGGETHDAETGLHHLAHLACCAMFVLWHEQNGGR